MWRLNLKGRIPRPIFTLIISKLFATVFSLILLYMFMKVQLWLWPIDPAHHYRYYEHSIIGGLLAISYACRVAEIDPYRISRRK